MNKPIRASIAIPKAVSDRLAWEAAEEYRRFVDRCNRITDTDIQDAQFERVVRRASNPGER